MCLNCGPTFGCEPDCKSNLPPELPMPGPDHPLLWVIHARANLLDYVLAVVRNDVKTMHDDRARALEDRVIIAADEYVKARFAEHKYIEATWKNTSRVNGITWDDQGNPSYVQ